MDTTTTTSRIKDRLTEGRRQIEAQVTALKERVIPLWGQVKHQVEDGVAGVKHRVEDGVAGVKHRVEDGVAVAATRLSHTKAAEALRDVAVKLGLQKAEPPKPEATIEVKPVEPATDKPAQ